jgi:hypothetical protein
MNEIQGELARKRGASARGLRERFGAGGELPEGGVGRDADLAGRAERSVAFERDHVGDGRIVEEISVKLREFGIGDENERELAWRAPAAEARGQGIEEVNGAFDGASIETQATMAISD